MSPFRSFSLVMVVFCLAGFTVRAELPAAKPDEVLVRTDHYGDPLPEGAVARLGTLRFRHPTGSIWRWAISPDGKTVATGSLEEKAVIFWDGATGKELRRIKEMSGVCSIAYSRSGKFLTVGTYGGTEIVLFDATTCKELQHFKIRGGGLWGVTFADGEKELVTVCEDGATRWWDTGTGKMLREWNCLARSAPKEERPVLRQARFSADGRVMVAHTRRLRPIGEKPDSPDEPKKPIEEGLTVWDLENRKELTFVRNESPDSFDLSPDGKYLAWSKIAEGIFLTDTKTGNILHRLDLDGKAVSFHDMAFNPDNKILATAHPFGQVRLWDTASGKLKRTVSTSGLDLAGLLFTPDGKSLLTRTARTISALEVATGKKLFPWEGHHDSVNFLNFSGDDRRLVTATGIGMDSIRYPSEVTTWERATWKPSARSTNEMLDLQESLPTSLDNTLAAHDSEEGRITLTDVATKKPLRIFEGTYKSILHAYGRFSPNHRVLMLASEEKDKFEHLFFEVDSGKYLGRIPGSEFPLVFSPDERLVAWFACGDQRLYVAEVAGGKRRAMDWAPKKELTDSHQPALVFSPEGNFLATWDFKGSDAFIWRIATGKEALRIPSANIRRISLAWSPTGRMLAVGRGTDKGDTIDLVEASTGLVRRTLPGHRANLASLAFSHDGRLLVSGSEDTTTLVWDVYGSTKKAERDLTTDSLGSNNATEAHAAIASLIQRPEKAVSVLRDKLAPTVKPKAERIKELWADLDNEDFDVRAQAVRSLSELSDLAAPTLKELLGGKPSAEQRRLGEELLKALHEDQPTAPALLRSLRGIEALEVIGTPGARAVLEALAKGAEESRQTREAKSALKRIARREPNP